MKYGRYYIAKNSVKISWAISYAIVLLISLSLCSVVYIYMESIMETEINRFNDIFLKQTQQYIDGLVVDAKLTGINIALSPQINELIDMKNPLSDSDKQKISECMRLLREYKLSNSSIHSMYIYLKNLDMVIDGQNMEPSADYYNALIRHNNLYYSDWIDTLTRYYRSGHYTMGISSKAYNNASLKDISYIRSLPLLRPDINNASVVLSINENKFLTMVENIKKEYSGEVMIIDSSNSIVWSTLKAAKLPEKVRYEELNTENRTVSTYLNGNKVVVLYINSSSEDWKYMLIIPTKVFWYKLIYVRRFIFYAIILSVLLCSVAIYIVLKKNYTPVHSLVDSISNQSDFSPGTHLNEYSYIQSAVKRIADERDSMKLELIGQKAALRTHFFERLLKDRVREIPDDSIAALDIDFISECFGVMLFYIEELNGEMWQEADSYDMEVLYKVFQYTTQDMVEKLFEGKCRIYVIAVDDMIACIVNIGSDLKDKADDILPTLAGEIHEYMLTTNNTDVKIALSNIHNGAAGIPAAYSEAMEAMEYKEIMGIKGIVTYTSSQDNRTIEYYYPIEQEQQVINNIRLGEFAATEQMLQGLFEENIIKRKISPYMVKCLMYNMLGTILKAMNDFGTAEDGKYLAYITEFERLMGQLMHNKNVNETRNEMLKILKEVCDSISSSRKLSGAGQNIRKDIDNYILENYMDANLCISSIGSHFNMSPSYLSKLYKAQSGQSILDAINKVRIDKAKQILADKKITIEDVAKAVGYSSVRTFIRIFIKRQGITPGKFKEISSGL